jgi:hypothetical protein
VFFKSKKLLRHGGKLIALSKFILPVLLLEPAPRLGVFLGCAPPRYAQATHNPKTPPKAPTPKKKEKELDFKETII